MPDILLSDVLTILLLIALEGVLSADNAMVLAVLVLGLPKAEQRRALRYGIVGAFVMRAGATVLAAELLGLAWVKLVGGAYLLWLPYEHFFSKDSSHHTGHVRPATAWLGMGAFWATVVRVEMTDLIFAVDSILVAVALSNKLWVVITGGVLGIVMMRLVIGQMLGLIRRYPALVDGAFIIITWVGFKLLLEYAHGRGWIHFAIPKWLSLSLIVVIMGGAYVYARRQGPVEGTDEGERKLVEDDARTPLA